MSPSWQLAAAALFILLGARSQKNSWIRHILGLYLYSTGATRQQISVLNHLGLVVSYVTLAGRGGKKSKKTNVSPQENVDAARTQGPTTSTNPTPSDRASSSAVNPGQAPAGNTLTREGTSEAQRDVEMEAARTEGAREGVNRSEWDVSAGTANGDVVMCGNDADEEVPCHNHESRSGVSAVGRGRVREAERRSVGGESGVDAHGGRGSDVDGDPDSGGLQGQRLDHGGQAGRGSEELGNAQSVEAGGGHDEARGESRGPRVGQGDAFLIALIDDC